MDFPRRALALCLFAVAFGTNVATPLFLIYEVELGLSTWTVTALFAIYPIGLAPALVFAGPVSDVHGRRPVEAVGLILSGVASVVMMFGGHQIGLLFVGRFLLGAVSGLSFVTASAWMQELGGDPMRNARTLSTLIYTGFGLGPFVGGILGQWGPAPLVSPYLVHLGLVAAALVVFAKIPETVVTPRPRPKVRPSLGIPAGREQAFWWVLFPTAIGVFAFPALAFGLFPVLLRPQMGAFAVVATGVMFLIAMWMVLPTQGWVGRVGPTRAAPIGLLLGAVGAAAGLIAFQFGWWPVLLPGALAMGACSGIAMTSGLRLVEALTAPDKRGALTGAFYAAAYAGMVSPVVVSTIAGWIGYTPVLTAMSVAAVTCAWVIDRSERRIGLRAEESPL